MKALTLRHPWPFCIAHWSKRIENRSWIPPHYLLDKRIAIHGGKKPTGALQLLSIKKTFDELVQKHGEPNASESVSFIQCGIVCTAVISHSMRTSSDPWYDGSGFGWVLKDVLVLPEPIPCSGAQGLWEVPADVLERIKEQNCD